MRDAVIAASAALICIAFLGANDSLFAQGPKRKSNTTAVSKRSPDGKPTAADAKAVIEKQISNGRFKVFQITKTNGAEHPAFQVYRLFYTVQVECLVSEANSSGLGRLLIISSSHQAVPCENKGDLHTGKGRLDFNKTERGWTPIDGGLQEGWFEQVKTDTRAVSSVILVPVPTEYDKFLGVWSYNDFNEKNYFRVTKDQLGRLQFDEGWNDYDDKSRIVWGREAVMLTNTEGIFLEPLNGKLQGRFVSANFRPTRGHDFTYTVTLQFQPGGKLLYTLAGDMAAPEKNLATKISEK